MRFNFKTLFLLGCLVSSAIHSLKAQEFSSFAEAEDSINILRSLIQIEKNDSVKIRKNLQLGSLFMFVLKMPGSGAYPFDTLKQFGRLTSPDNKFRIFTWNSELCNGNQKYFGIIQVNPGSPEKSNSIFLHDSSDSMNIPEEAVLGFKNWYGALYYNTIPFQTRDMKTAYILLGWHGEDIMVTRKVIDVIKLDSNGGISFGLPVFPKYGRGRNTRIIFSYSATASMVLRYEEQRISNNQKWNTKKRTFEQNSKKAKMIVFDHLIPLDPKLEGQFQFYVPSSDQADGFIFDGREWVFTPDIDARNKQ